MAGINDTDDNSLKTDITIKATLFQSQKGLLSMFLVFCLSAIIAISLPFIFKGSQGSFLMGTVMFFIIPVFSFPIIKKKCLREVLLFYNQIGFSVSEPNQDIKKAIKWDEIESHRIQSFKNLSGIGFVWKIKLKNCENFKFALIDNELLNFTKGGNDTLIQTICGFVRNYNKNQKEHNNQINLLPGFFATKPGSYFLWLPVFLALFDILYRLSHPLTSQQNTYFLLLVIVITFGFWAQRRKDQKIYTRILELQEGIENPA